MNTAAVAIPGSDTILALLTLRRHAATVQQLRCRLIEPAAKLLREPAPPAIDNTDLSRAVAGPTDMPTGFSCNTSLDCPKTVYGMKSRVRQNAGAWRELWFYWDMANWIILMMKS